MILIVIPAFGIVSETRVFLDFIPLFVLAGDPMVVNDQGFLVG